VIITLFSVVKITLRKITLRKITLRKITLRKMHEINKKHYYLVRLNCISLVLSTINIFSCDKATGEHINEVIIR